MTKNEFSTIGDYMLSCMNDGAHDGQHIYRVLYYALDIASYFELDKDVLIASALLHDIGRSAQFQNQKLDHAVVGSEMAYEYRKGQKWSDEKAGHVKDCICTHRFRNDKEPVTIEAKILFDSDKLDATGTLGIARTLAYKGIVGEPLYSVSDEGNILDGKEDSKPSFFQEYHYKLKNVYERFFTKRAQEIANERRMASISFYERMLNEVRSTHEIGREKLNRSLESEVSNDSNNKYQ